MRNPLTPSIGSSTPSWIPLGAKNVAALPRLVAQVADLPDARRSQG